MKAESRLILSVIVVLSIVSTCQAIPVEWPPADGGNGHFYIVIAAADPISWPDANEVANLLGGHLVTITSAEENDFVFNLIDDDRYWYRSINLRGPWIGGYQLLGSPEPAGGWTWVTAEQFIYANWEMGQPNNYSGGQNENRIHFGNKPVRVPTWNDVVSNFEEIRAYVVEFSKPNGIPVEWPVADGGNNHLYLAVSVPHGITWIEANRVANLSGGYLATITSGEENDFVSKLINDDIYWTKYAPNVSIGPWIGGYQLPGSLEPSDGWHWVIDEPLAYTNWGQGKPDNSLKEGPNENCLHFLRLITGGVPMTIWNDLPDDYVGVCGYVIEFPPGPSLPKFEGINIDFSPSQARDRMILVCFWDMNQRPSRNCMIQLRKKVQELKEKGIVVIAVHASKVEEKTLNEWVKKYNITFPMGMIRSDEEQILFNWGVKSLPWLILTDTKHVVRAEGFGVNELEDRLRQNNGG